MILSFDPAAHIYRVDGRVVDSVSQIAQGFQYKNEPLFIDTRWYKASGTNRGSSVHEQVEMINLGVLSPRDFAGSAHESYINAYGSFLADTGFKAEFAEILVYHPQLDFCGTVDAIGKRDGMDLVTDLKTGSPERWHALQVNAYRLAIRDNPYLYRLTEHTDGNGAFICEAFANPYFGKSLPMRVLYLRKTGRYAFVSDHKGESFDSPTFEATWIGATYLRNWRNAA